MAPVPNQHPFLQRQDSSEPSSMSNTPCLDILLSENILAHILAASRMPVSIIFDSLLCNFFVHRLIH